LLPSRNVFISARINDGKLTNRIHNGIKDRQLMSHNILFHLLFTSEGYFCSNSLTMPVSIKKESRNKEK
jgi:hypothetical protein